MTEPFPMAAVIAVVSAAKNTEPRDDVIECCEVCSEDIKTMVFKGTGVCGERCRKRKLQIIDEEKAVSP